MNDGVQGMQADGRERGAAWGDGPRRREARGASDGGVG
jgi:hypothetical protein